MLENIKIVTTKSEEQLNDRQLQIYRQHREKLARWALSIGKNPSKAEGYAEETVKRRLYRLDLFYRFIWDKNGFTLEITPEHADEWMRELAYQDTSQGYNASCQKAVKMLFKWLRHDKNQVIDWDPELTFSSSTTGAEPRHYFTKEQLRKLADTALEYDSLPCYSGVSPQERSQINIYLAQRLGKPKDQIGSDDWDQVNSWKIASLVNVTIDAALRNSEVKNARVTWIDWDREALAIPVEDASKVEDYWDAALRPRTMLCLENWVEEREMYDKYTGSDHLWLNRYGNPYSRQALNNLLDNLQEAAGMNPEKGTWYSIRRGAVTAMQHKGGMAATQKQARHKSRFTTARYDQAPLDDRRTTLENMFS